MRKAKAKQVDTSWKDTAYGSIFYEIATMHCYHKADEKTIENWNKFSLYIEEHEFKNTMEDFKEAVRVAYKIYQMDWRYRDAVALNLETGKFEFDLCFTYNTDLKGYIRLFEPTEKGLKLRYNEEDYKGIYLD